MSLQTHPLSPGELDSGPFLLPLPRSPLTPVTVLHYRPDNTSPLYGLFRGVPLIQYPRLLGLVSQGLSELATSLPFSPSCCPANVPHPTLLPSQIPHSHGELNPLCYLGYLCPALEVPSPSPPRHSPSYLPRSSSHGKGAISAAPGLSVWPSWPPAALCRRPVVASLHGAVRVSAQLH